MPAMPFLVIILMSFLERAVKGLHYYYSPQSGPEVARGRDKHVQSRMEKNSLTVIDFIQPPPLSKETQKRLKACTKSHSQLG